MKRFTLRVLAAIFLVASIVIAAIPVNSLSSENTDVTRPSDFQIEGSKLLKYTGTASVVSVPNGVKTIGESAFDNNSNLKKISFPDGLKEIAYAAFNGCNNLAEVDIPDSIEEIGTAAFANCSSLEKVTIGTGLSKLGTGVFVGCKKLSIVIFKSAEHFVLNYNAIFDENQKKLYEVLPGQKNNIFIIPPTVSKIMPYAFYGIDNIEEVYLSKDLQEIPPYAFSNCTGLKTITIPYATNLLDIKSFENCVNLSEVNISKSVSYIAPSAFDGCFKLKINAPEGSYADEWYRKFLTNNVDKIEKEEAEEVIDNVDETIIGDYISETIVVARKAVFFIDNTALTVHGKEYDPSAIIADMEGVLKTETNGKGLSLPKLAILNDTISDKAFYADSSLYSYDIPKDITGIGDFAFARTPLKEITIPEGVTNIGYGAFYHCDNLSKIVVPPTVTNIEPSAFSNTRMMENWLLYGSSDFLIMGDGILVAYKGKDSVVNLPEGIKQIGPEAFKNNKRITEIYLNDGLIRICEEAFAGCTNLKNISGGTNVKYIEDRAFYSCPIETVRIVDSVKSLGYGAFDVTNTSLNNEYKAVYFHGDILPSVSYNKTTTRLSNGEFRIDSLNGIRVAIVNREDVNRLGTVLDRSVSGFSGLICVINEPNTDYFNGTLKIIDCTLTKDEASSIYFPTTIYVYGKGYNFNKDELSNVLEMAREGAYENELLVPQNSQIVKFPGITDDYLLTIDELQADKTDIEEAYKRIYAVEPPKNTTYYDINLYEPTKNIALTKFGKQALKITLSLPDKVSSRNLHVICTDNNGQLEDLSYEVKAIEDELYVVFDISHTGYYAIYSLPDNSVITAAGLDISPDTGDYLNPKWFLSIGLLALSLILFLIKPRKL